MKKIGIIGAMAGEVSELKARMTVQRQFEQASMVFVEGELEGVAAVVVQSGIGKVNAAVCAQILVDKFAVTHLLNTGIAGSLEDQIDIGDLVISQDTLQHDMDATDFGYPAGQIPGMAVRSFTADEGLVRIAREANAEANPDIHAYVGRIVSGDQFVAADAVKARIKASFAGLCTEMEGAAIAQTAYLNKIPFVIIRAISDKADHSAQIDYPTFEQQAIARSVSLVIRMMQKLAAEQAD